MTQASLSIMLAAIACLPAAGDTTTFELPQVSGVPTLLPGWSGFSPVVLQHGDARVQDTLAAAGSQALEMSPVSAVAWSPDDRTAPSGHVLVSSFQLRLDTLSTDGPVIPSETLSAVVFANASGLMALDGNGSGGGTWQTLQALAADTFYTITITRNYVSQTYDVEVDGSLVAENFGFKDPVAAGPFTATFESSGRAWLDDVSADFIPSGGGGTGMVANFSFESPDVTGGIINGVPTGWTAPNGTDGIKVKDDYAGLAAAIPDGNQWGVITFTSSNKHVTMAQDTGVTIVEGVTYTLTVAVGEQDNFAGVDNIARIFLYGSTTGGATPFALLDNIDPIPDANITAGDDSIWIDYQVSFTATAAQAGESLVVGLGAGGNIGNGESFTSNVSFDNVRLQAATYPSGGSLVVYEPFDYTQGTDIVGQSGGTGFEGAWTGAGTTTANDVGAGLSFGSLSVAGGANLRSERSGNGAISRTLTDTAKAALTGDNSTIWFSALMDPTGGNGFAVNSYGTLIFGDTAFTSASGTSAPALPGGNAFGVGFVGESNGADASDFAKVGIQGVTYNGGILNTAGNGTVADVGDVVSFIVGRIDFAPIGSNDTLRLYRVTDPNLALPASPFATLTANLDQSGFNVISIGDSQTSVFDEIRIGTSYDAVIGNEAEVDGFEAYITHPDFGLDPDERGFDQDPDGDSLANGLEAWFGTHPGEFNAGITNLVTNGTVTTFAHPRNETPPVDISGFYQWSPNLIDWYACDGVDGPSSGPTVAISIETIGTTTTVAAEASGVMERIFLRCGVTQP